MTQNKKMISNLNALIEQADDPQTVYDELLKRDFGLFLRKSFPVIAGGAELAWNWHLHAIAYQLSRVENSDICRLLVTLPPRNLKSISISVAWVAWMLGKDPTLNFVCVSYSGELGGKLARQCRTIMEQSWYRRIFPGTVISAKRSATYDFETTAGGGRHTTSISGTLTGRGGDIIIIDDPIKPDEALSETTRENVNDWYRTTLSSRLNDKANGAIICVMQRLHAYDLAGLILEDGGWEHLNLPAIATEDESVPLCYGQLWHRREGDILHPERESAETLADLKSQMGSAVFSAQYQQDPVPPHGNMVEQEWLQNYSAPLAQSLPGQIIQSWDTASKDGINSDWSVCITAHVKGRDVYILDVYRKRLTFPELKKQVIRLAEFHKVQVLLIEDAASGTQLIQELRHGNNFEVPRPRPQKPEGDKVTRLAGVTAMIEAGQLHLPEQASWRADFESELLGFPSAKYDDQVDALSQLLNWVRKRPAPIRTDADVSKMLFGKLIEGGGYETSF